jgi:hypothetical protein
MEHKLINGIKVPLTAEEIAQRQADELQLGMLVHLIELWLT